MNAELEVFLRCWQSSLEASSGKSVVQLHLDTMTTMPMLLRVYNALDVMGDGDGILSRSDGDEVWNFLQTQNIVADSEYVLSLTIEQFRLALVNRVIGSTVITPTEVVLLATGQDVANFIQKRIDAEVMLTLEKLAAAISVHGGDCPPLASVAPFQHPHDRSKQNPMTLSHSVVLTDEGFAAAKQVFDALDTDQDGNLDRSDFGHVNDGEEGTNPSLAKLGDQIMALDTDADGVVRSFNPGCHMQHPSKSSSVTSDALTVCLLNFR
eukprot:COSAG02_NODE_3604_length_6492_cov_3.323166_5_plen_266_part_00